MADVERRQFTVAEFARMGEIGIFSEQERVELLAGEIIRMNPVGARHVVVNQLNDLFHRLLGETAIVSMQTPVVLDEDNQPRSFDRAAQTHQPGGPARWQPSGARQATPRGSQAAQAPVASSSRGSLVNRRAYAQHPDLDPGQRDLGVRTLRQWRPAEKD